MTDKKPTQQEPSDHWGDLTLELVDDVPDAEEGEGMTPEEIRAFLDRPVRTEQEGP